MKEQYLKVILAFGIFYLGLLFIYTLPNIKNYIDTGVFLFSLEMLIKPIKPSIFSVAVIFLVNILTNKSS